MTWPGFSVSALWSRASESSQMIIALKWQALSCHLTPSLYLLFKTAIHASSCHSCNPSNVNPTGSLTLTSFPAAMPSKLSGWAFLPLWKLENRGHKGCKVIPKKGFIGCLNKFRTKEKSYLLSCGTPVCVSSIGISCRHTSISSTCPKPSIGIDRLENRLLATFAFEVTFTTRRPNWGNVICKVQD